jgi:hypothetical protein
VAGPGRHHTPPHSRTALRTIVANTGRTSVGELPMTRSISSVASSCFSAAKRFSRLPTREPSVFGDVRATGSLASTLAFAGFAPFAPRGNWLSLPVTDVTDRAEIDNRLSEGGRVGKVGMVADSMMCQGTRVLGGLGLTVLRWSRTSHGEDWLQLASRAAPCQFTAESVGLTPPLVPCVRRTVFVPGHTISSNVARHLRPLSSEPRSGIDTT